MEFYLLLVSLVLHVVAAVVILAYIPVKLLLRAFIREPHGKEDLKGKVVLITGASSGIGEGLAYQYAKEGARLALVARRKQALKGVAADAREHGSPDVLVLEADVADPEESRRAIEETVAQFGKLNIWSPMLDVNFWGSIYATYYALPHLKASKGKLIVTSSAAGTVPTSRLTFYNASKAALLRFYETLRSEIGTEVGITILTPGYVDSEMTQGKMLDESGKLTVDEEARDVQIGPFPVGRVKKLCEIALDSIRKGDWYVMWPSFYQPLQLIAFLAPEVMNWLSYTLYNDDRNSRPLSQRILEATGAKRLCPPSLRHPAIKTD